MENFYITCTLMGLESQYANDNHERWHKLWGMNKELFIFAYSYASDCHIAFEILHNLRQQVTSINNNRNVRQLMFKSLLLNSATKVITCATNTVILV